MKKPAKIWFSFKGGVSEEDHISFYDVNDFEWTSKLESNGTLISEEISQYLIVNEERIKPYFNKSLVTAKSKWRTSAFFFWKWPVKKNMKQCPKTMTILKEIPGILSASISILESGTTIKPHRGDTNAIVRAHFPIKVPDTLPDCGFKVNNETRPWEERKLLLFNDAALHTAWNVSSKRRYVLLFDVIRPEYFHKKYTVSSLVLASLLMQSFIQNIPFLKYVPRIILGMGLYSISFIINPILRFRSI